MFPVSKSECRSIYSDDSTTYQQLLFSLYLELNGGGDCIQRLKTKSIRICEELKRDSNALHFHHFYCIHCAIPIHKTVFLRMHENKLTLLMIIRKNLYNLTVDRMIGLMLRYQWDNE